MRCANLSGRLVLVGPGDTALDVEKASDGTFSSSPQGIYQRWDDFCAWASTVDLSDAEPYDPALLEAPVPWPRQLFAIGLNYQSHATEVGQRIEDLPPVFTKFVTAITGPYVEVAHPGGSVDWEVELVVVVGRGGYRIPLEDAWSHVAGLTAGQDISERETQHIGDIPQFSLGKSFPGFAPMGPCLVTPDEFADKDDLQLETWVNGEQMQCSRTSEMIFPVGVLVERLSKYTPLLPGDVIYTGTPAGIGMSRTPPRFLAVGDVLTTRISGIGSLRTVMVAGRE